MGSPSCANAAAETTWRRWPPAIASSSAVWVALGRLVLAALVDRFVAEARAAGASRAVLVTLAGDAGAAPFYDRLGWQRAGEQNRDGQTTSMFVLPLAG
jgi:hypothetical protein